MLDICYFTIKVFLWCFGLFHSPEYLIISLLYKIIHHLDCAHPGLPHCYASQSSSSAFECRTGSGGMASDILAKAPPVPLWPSPASPPAGPFPEIPAVWTLSVSCLSTPAPGSRNQSDVLPFRRMASLLKRSDMKSPPLDAAATAARPKERTVVLVTWLEERRGFSRSRTRPFIATRLQSN